MIGALIDKIPMVIRVIICIPAAVIVWSFFIAACAFLAPKENDNQ